MSSATCTRAPVPYQCGIGAAVLTLSLAACTPSPDTSDDTPPATGAAPSQAVTAPPQPELTAPAAAPVPEVRSSEIARSIHAAAGTGGVPETTDTITGEITAQHQYTVEGSCSGDATMPFTVSTAAPGQERTTLLEGSITCDGLVQTDGFDYQFDYEGPAQLTITRADDLTHGWVVVHQSG